MKIRQLVTDTEAGSSLEEASMTISAYLVKTADNNEYVHTQCQNYNATDTGYANNDLNVSLNRECRNCSSDS